MPNENGGIKTKHMAPVIGDRISSRHKSELSNVGGSKKQETAKDKGKSRTFVRRN